MRGGVDEGVLILLMKADAPKKQIAVQHEKFNEKPFSSDASQSTYSTNVV